MKKINFNIVFIVIITVILFGQVYSSSAQDSYIYSVRLQKSISLPATLADFSDAEAISLNAGLFTKEMYIKNSESDLYIALRVTNNASLQGIALVFDVDHDQKFTNDVKILFNNQTKLDGYFNQNSALSLQSQTFFTGAVSSISYIDGKTYKFYQFDINFNPSSNSNYNPTTDMYIPDPSDYMLGFDLIEITSGGLISWTRGNLTDTNSILALSSNASSFYSMILAGPGKYAVPDFSPVATTNPPASTSVVTAATSTYTAVINQGETTSMATKATPGFEILGLMITIPFVIILKRSLSRMKKL